MKDNLKQGNLSILRNKTNKKVEPASKGTLQRAHKYEHLHVTTPEI
jgi:hypothetical protein